MKLKHLIGILAIASLASIIYGFTLDDEQLKTSHKYIGGGTVCLFLVVMPLFLYNESKGKKINDYMLTEENIRKMQAKKSKSTDNQPDS